MRKLLTILNIMLKEKPGMECRKASNGLTSITAAFLSRRCHP
jgi:hypothetical protein